MSINFFPREVTIHNMMQIHSGETSQTVVFEWDDVIHHSATGITLADTLWRAGRACRKPHGIGWGNNEQTKFAMEPNQKTKELRPIVVPVILLQIVMVSPGTHFVKNPRVPGSRTNKSQFKKKPTTTTTNPKSKMLGPLCNQTVNLQPDAKTLYYSILKIKYSPSILKHNKG